jgi:hypothetical protein
VVNFAFERQPGLQTVFISGFAPDAVLRHGLLDPDTVFIARPFTRDEIAFAIRHALDLP